MSNRAGHGLEKGWRGPWGLVAAWADAGLFRPWCVSYSPGWDRQGGDGCHDNTSSAEAGLNGRSLFKREKINSSFQPWKKTPCVCAEKTASETGAMGEVDSKLLVWCFIFTSRPLSIRDGSTAFPRSRWARCFIPGFSQPLSKLNSPFCLECLSAFLFSPAVTFLSPLPFVCSMEKDEEDQNILPSALAMGILLVCCFQHFSGYTL